MSSRKWFGFSIVVFALVMFFAGQSFAITYLHIYVDGEESDVLVQGQPYAFEMDCNPLDTVYMEVVPDLNSNGMIDPDETSVIPPDVWIIDNAEPDPEGPPFFDSDPTEGRIRVEMFIYMWPGDWVVRFSDRSGSVSGAFHILPPEPLLYSVSGRVTLEGVEPPDVSLSHIPMMAGAMEPPMMMYFLTDSMGDFSFNWPGEAGELVVMVMLPEGDDFDTTVYVDGHITDFNIFIPSAVPVDSVTIDYESDPDNEPVDPGEIQAVYFDVETEEPYDTVIFPSTGPIRIPVFRDAYQVKFMAVEPDMREHIFISPAMPLFLSEDDYPPEYYIYVNPTNYHLRVTLRGMSPDSLPEEGLSIDFSGWDTVGHDYRGKLEFSSVFADSEYVVQGECELCDANWTIRIPDMLPGGYVPAFTETTFVIPETPDWPRMDIVVPVEIYAVVDSILVNFSYDPDGWEVRQDELQATYIDATTYEVLSVVPFPPEGPVYLPVREDSCGIIFGGSYPEFLEHVFLSPAETLWVSGESYPEGYDIYANTTNYHFMLIFDGFELDSVPPEGISCEFFGSDAEGHTYYTKHTVFIDFYHDEYVVGGERELCDAGWMLVLPDTLPGNYIPAFTETTFAIPETTDWPWYEMHIPVHFSGISSDVIPRGMEVKLYPNPFNGSVAVSFHLEGSSPVLLEVYNIAGELVTSLVDKQLPRGDFSVRWSGTTMDGSQAASGIYLFRLKVGNETRVLKGLYIR